MNEKKFGCQKVLTFKPNALDRKGDGFLLCFVRTDSQCYFKYYRADRQLKFPVDTPEYPSEFLVEVSPEEFEKAKKSLTERFPDAVFTSEVPYDGLPVFGFFKLTDVLEALDSVESHYIYRQRPDGFHILLPTGREILVPLDYVGSITDYVQKTYQAIYKEVLNVYSAVIDPIHSLNTFDQSAEEPAADTNIDTNDTAELDSSTEYKLSDAELAVKDIIVPVPDNAPEQTSEPADEETEGAEGTEDEVEEETEEVLPASLDPNPMALPADTAILPRKKKRRHKHKKNPQNQLNQPVADKPEFAVSEEPVVEQLVAPEVKPADVSIIQPVEDLAAVAAVTPVPSPVAAPEPLTDPVFKPEEPAIKEIKPEWVKPEEGKPEEIKPDEIADALSSLDVIAPVAKPVEEPVAVEEAPAVDDSLNNILSSLESLDDLVDTKPVKPEPLKEPENAANAVERISNEMPQLDLEALENALNEGPTTPKLPDPVCDGQRDLTVDEITAELQKMSLEDEPETKEETKPVENSVEPVKPVYSAETELKQTEQKPAGRFPIVKPKVSKQPVNVDEDMPKPAKAEDSPFVPAGPDRIEYDTTPRLDIDRLTSDLDKKLADHRKETEYVEPVYTAIPPVKKRPVEPVEETPAAAQPVEAPVKETVYDESADSDAFAALLDQALSDDEALQDDDSKDDIYQFVDPEEVSDKQAVRQFDGKYKVYRDIDPHSNQKKKAQ